MIKLGKLLGPKRLLKVALEEANAVCERWDVPHVVEMEAEFECASAPQPGTKVNVARGDGQVFNLEILRVVRHANGVAHVIVSMPVLDDLNDLAPRMTQLRSGHAVSGRLLRNDFVLGGPAPLGPTFLGLVPLSEMVLSLLTGVSPHLLLPALTLVAGALYLAWEEAKAFKIPLTVSGMLGVFGATLLPASISASTLPALGSQAEHFWPLFLVGAAALIVAGVASLRHMDQDIAVRRFTRRPFWTIFAGAIGASYFLPHFLTPLLLWLPAVSLPWLYSRALDTSWAALLVRQENLHPHNDHPSQASFISARLKQAKAALLDRTPLITLGIASGLFTSRQDGFAPDRGKALMMSVLDLSGHLLTIGATGSGKTSGVLRPIIAQLAVLRAVGMLVLDGKGELAGELKGLRGYTVIEPGVKLGLMDGLDPQSFADAIYAVCAASDVGTGQNSAKQSPFFSQNGYTAIYYAAVILYVAVKAGVEGYAWTIDCVQRVLTDGFSKDGAEKITALSDAITNTGFNFRTLGRGGAEVWTKAFGYWATGEIPTMAPETKANLSTTVSGWLLPLSQHESLIEWSQTSGGIDISDILTGHMYGVALPQVKYGRAGDLIQSLIKQRVFVLNRSRPRNWKATQKPVLIVVDEAQDIVGEADAKFLPVARSMGGYCLYATQNIDAFLARLGGSKEKAATSWLDNFRSQIVLKSSSETKEWVSKTLGMSFRPSWARPRGAVGYEKDSIMLSKSALMDTAHPLYDHMRWLRVVHHAGQVVPSVDFELGTQGWMRGVQSNETSLLSLNAHDNVEWVEQPLFTVLDADTRLVTEHIAVANIWRAGVPRRDVIDLIPMFEFPPELLTAGKPEPKVD